MADSLDGRFDLLAFHAWLALKALKQAGQDMAAQGLTDIIFTGFDEAMREQGAGDMGIGHKLKKFADAFYGRLTAYDTSADQAGLARRWRKTSGAGRMRTPGRTPWPLMR